MQVYLLSSDQDPVSWRKRFSKMMYRELQDCYLRSRVYKQTISRLECLAAASPPQELPPQVSQLTP